ncbi:S66 peptidase family protein [Allonocardiopsis opalescens]|uniref:Muramoyltetrapeptide carboxypeptidase n=1 Tax=Allonocardiopsis opalescens TaxID=1144618 RepID=A0A2T0Q9I0_9ACTN|nr:LD-carboxypeptidase [Allonocardiopsis opalescens]PRY00528.1 muramoyltetrapeptide carboxypeptidase [Allonocardiopsis opalescens]
MTAGVREGAPPLRELVRPPRLRPGDRVAVVAPSSPVPPEVLAEGCALLRGWGLEVEVAPHVLRRHRSLPHLAGSDAGKVDDLQAAWLDPGVAAVLCARGGYGAHRIVDLLDWAALAAAPPKVLAGFSDVTALHTAFAVRLGLSTLHAPMPGSPLLTGDERGQELLRRALFEPESVQVLGGPDAVPLVGGRARGITVGGCASLLAADLGTPTALPGARGGILLLEDIGEEPGRLDRILTQLLRSGWLDGVAGIALGSWEDCGPPEVLRALMLDRLGPLGVPIVWEHGFGHCGSQFTVPLGVPAVLDADAGLLTLELPALR